MSIPASRRTRDSTETAGWPIRFDEVLAARERLRPYLTPSPLRTYPVLDALVGHGIRVLVKHENLQPTNASRSATRSRS